jgi:pyruvate/2-oxoglutarate dehydrogenase complex dihydrolipoamide dehydrogenase (E3) component
MRYDVIVIGSGQAGVPLAARLAEAGKHVLVVERAFLGGTCINTGCTPTKTMMASARAAQSARRAARLGVHTGPVHVDLAAVVDRKNGIVEQWRAGVQRRLEGAGDRLQWRHGEARFLGPRDVQVGDETHSAETIIVNTGGRPVVPPLTGLDRVDFLDNASIMQLREIPKHLIILGGGSIAVEFGQMFRRFGSEVTILQRSQHLLGREDEDVAKALEDAFVAEGIQIRFGVQAKAVSEDPEGLFLELQDGASVRGSHLLVAIGREPNTKDLGCDAAGIDLDKHGAIVADEHYHTTAPGVYAVGDVLGGAQFTHNSWDDHRLLFDILNGRERHRSGRLVPYSVFTDPQLARVGLSETEAKGKGIAYEVATMPFANIARAIELDETAGILKVLIDPKTEKILGAAIVGIEAGELIHIFVALMQAGATARAIVDAQAIHPTLAEGVQSLVMSLDRYKL